MPVCTAESDAMSNWKKIKGGASMPLGNWKRVTPLLNVVGIQYRKDEAHRFAKAAIQLHDARKPFGLIIEREPNNTHDKNALMVIGWAAGVNRHVGYVDSIEAARAAARFPKTHLAAEFYSTYLGGGGFIDIRFFLAVPVDAVPLASGRVRSLLERTRDELLVLSYAARADNKLGRLESQVLNNYAAERARDYNVSLVDEAVADIKRWCKEQAPSSDEVQVAIHRLADEDDFSPAELWELIEIVLGIDGKISKAERTVADELAAYIREAATARST